MADIYSWDDCVKLVSETNPALLSARAQLQSAEETTLSDRSDYFPQLSGTIGYNYTNSLTVSSGSNVVLNSGGSNGQSTGSYQLTGTATQNIFNGLQDMAKVDQGKAQEEVAQANLETVKAQISYNLKTNFGYLIYAKNEVDLARRIADRRATNLRLVELRFRDGQENKGSVLLYEAYLKDAKYGVTQANDNVTTGKVQLAQALGLSEYLSLEIKGDVPLHPVTARLSDLGALAIKAPAYENAVGQEHSADAGVTLARSNFFPTLGVTAGVGTSGPWFPDNNHWSLGVALTIPIFNGGRDYYATISAIQSRVAAEKTRDDVLHQTNAAIANAYTNYVEAIENVTVCQAYLDADQVRVEIARADYKNGLMSFTDWDLVETDLITREKNLLQAEQTRVTAEATWEQTLGLGVLP
jgi:outer membrane protein